MFTREVAQDLPAGAADPAFHCTGRTTKRPGHFVILISGPQDHHQRDAFRFGKFV
jgi:hypothetical protein